jgi:hypothetical protein
MITLLLNAQFGLLDQPLLGMYRAELLLPQLSAVFHRKNAIFYFGCQMDRAMIDGALMPVTSLRHIRMNPPRASPLLFIRTSARPAGSFAANLHHAGADT